MGRCGRLSEHVVEPTEPFAEPFGIKSNTVLPIPQPGSLQSNRKRDPVNELEDVRARCRARRDARAALAVGWAQWRSLAARLREVETR